MKITSQKTLTQPALLHISDAELQGMMTKKYLQLLLQLFKLHPKNAELVKALFNVLLVMAEDGN